jgi:hypothetical protein
MEQAAVGPDVWVFHGMGGRFTSGIFTTREKAEVWIKKHVLTGVLTRYPLDISAYDWALETGTFRIKKPEQTSAEFIQKFTSGSQEHYHYDPHDIG